MLKRFDHVNVRTANLDAMVTWYDDILEMKSGWRPDFPFPGAWLYIGEQAVVHLVGEDTKPVSEDPQIEHYAFRAAGFDDFIARLDARGVKYRLAEVADAGIIQINVFDPDGNHIHVDFDLSEKS